MPPDHKARWYAVLFCWEPEEGQFPGAVPEDDAMGNVSLRSPGVFYSKAEAEAWAVAHDLEDDPKHYDAWVDLR